MLFNDQLNSLLTFLTINHIIPLHSITSYSIRPGVISPVFTGFPDKLTEIPDFISENKNFTFNLLQTVSPDTVLVRSRVISPVLVPLIQVNEEYDVVPETTDPVESGHLYAEGEHVVYERVDRL